MTEIRERKVDFLKKHVDTVVVLGGILGSLIWMNGKFNDLDRRLVRIETIMIIKGIMPGEIAKTAEHKIEEKKNG